MAAQRELVLRGAEIPFSFAIFSADWPMERPVVYSAIAGGFGVSSSRRNPEKTRALAAADFDFESLISLFVNLREKRTGTSERHSDPPAMIESATPRAIFSAASVTRGSRRHTP